MVKIKKRSIPKKNQKEDYEEMYQKLLREMANALEFFQKKNECGIQEVQRILTDVQWHTEEMYMEAKEDCDYGDIYSGISERIDLQSLGYFIKEGSMLTKRRNSKFIDREKDAEKELAKQIDRWKKEGCNSDIYAAIVQYAAIREEIQFSLGMKVGAKLALLLTEDFKTDI